MLRNRNFLLLWLVNVVTTFAIELFSIAVLVVIFDQTESTVQAAGAMVVRALPAFLLGPLAGAYVDRFPRKNVLIVMDIVRLILVVVAVFMLQNSETIPVIGSYLVLLGLSAADVLHRPARLAIIPSLVPHEQLVKANSFILVSTQIMMAVAFTAGGWLVQIMPLTHITIGIGVSFVLAVIFAGLMMVPKREKTAEEKAHDNETVWESFASGLRYLRKHKIARPLTVMEALEHVPHGIWTGAIMLAFTVQALGETSAEFGYMATGYFSGMMLGSLMAMGMSNWLSRYPGRLIIINAVLSGLLTFAFAFSPNIWVSVVIGLFFGPPMALRDVAQDSLLQGTVAEAQLGRVYATREMLRSTIFMCSGLGFAWLSDIIPVRQIYMIGGVMYVLTGIYALGNKPLRESSMVEEMKNEA